MKNRSKQQLIWHLTMSFECTVVPAILESSYNIYCTVLQYTVLPVYGVENVYIIFLQNVDILKFHCSISPYYLASKYAIFNVYKILFAQKLS